MTGNEQSCRSIVRTFASDRKSDPSTWTEQEFSDQHGVVVLVSGRDWTLSSTIANYVFLKLRANGQRLDTQLTFLQNKFARYSLEASQVFENPTGSRFIIVFIFLKIGLHSSKLECTCSPCLKILSLFLYDQYKLENLKLLLFFLFTFSPPPKKGGDKTFSSPTIKRAQILGVKSSGIRRLLSRLRSQTFRKFLNPNWTSSTPFISSHTASLSSILICPVIYVQFLLGPQPQCSMNLYLS